jgi:hypothetical protein
MPELVDASLCDVRPVLFEWRARAASLLPGRQQRRWWRCCRGIGVLTLLMLVMLLVFLATCANHPDAQRYWLARLACLGSDDCPDAIVPVVVDVYASRGAVQRYLDCIFWLVVAFSFYRFGRDIYRHIAMSWIERTARLAPYVEDLIEEIDCIADRYWLLDRWFERFIVSARFQHRLYAALLYCEREAELIVTLQQKIDV